MLAGVEARGLHCYFSWLLSTYFVRQATSWNVELTDWAMLAGSWARGVPLFLPPSTGIIDTLCMFFFFFTWVLGSKPKATASIHLAITNSPRMAMSLYNLILIPCIIVPGRIIIPSFSLCVTSFDGMLGFDAFWPSYIHGDRKKNSFNNWLRIHLFEICVSWGRPHSVAQSCLGLTR